LAVLLVLMVCGCSVLIESKVTQSHMVWENGGLKTIVTETTSKNGVRQTVTTTTFEGIVDGSVRTIVTTETNKSVVVKP
jgi:translation elongation factor P/translation initiation factor 5A